MDIINRIKARTHAWRSEGSATPDVIDEVLEFVAAIEAAMREPVAEVIAYEGIKIVNARSAKLALFPLGTKLYALPPDAAGETERLKAEIHPDWDKLEATREALREQSVETERLQRKLMLVTNFPSHPGGHPDDQSGDAMVPEDWRHGWICAVAAIQEAVGGKGATK